MQCKFSGCSGSVNISYSKNKLKPKLWGDREDQGMKNAVSLNTLDMHSTAILRTPSCPFFAFPFSITKLNLQTAHTFISKC